MRNITQGNVHDNRAWSANIKHKSLTAKIAIAITDADNCIRSSTTHNGQAVDNEKSCASVIAGEIWTLQVIFAYSLSINRLSKEMISLLDLIKIRFIYEQL